MREPFDEACGQPDLAHLLLRLRDIVLDTPPGRRTTVGVDQQAGCARIVVARLADAARIQDKAPARPRQRDLGLADDPVGLDLSDPATCED